MNQNKSEEAPTPQVFIWNDKTVTMNSVRRPSDLH
jgi:hypothetical protein